MAMDSTNLLSVSRSGRPGIPDLGQAVGAGARERHNRRRHRIHRPHRHPPHPVRRATRARATRRGTEHHAGQPPARGRVPCTLLRRDRQPARHDVARRAGGGGRAAAGVLGRGAGEERHPAGGAAREVQPAARRDSAGHVSCGRGGRGGIGGATVACPNPCPPWSDTCPSPDPCPTPCPHCSDTCPTCPTPSPLPHPLDPPSVLPIPP